VLPPFFDVSSYVHHERVKVLNYSIRTNTILEIATWRSPSRLVIHKTDKHRDGSHFLCLCAYTQRNKKHVFLGEKRDPSERYANSNLRNLTHITQTPSYVYVFHLHAQRNHSLVEVWGQTSDKKTHRHEGCATLVVVAVVVLVAVMVVVLLLCCCCVVVLMLTHYSVMA